MRYLYLYSPHCWETFFKKEFHPPHHPFGKTYVIKNPTKGILESNYFGFNFVGCSDHSNEIEALGDVIDGMIDHIHPDELHDVFKPVAITETAYNNIHRTNSNFAKFLVNLRKTSSK